MVSVSGCSAVVHLLRIRTDTLLRSLPRVRRTVPAAAGLSVFMMPSVC